MSGNRVVAPPKAEAIQYPMIYQTRPDHLSWHVIEDHQLDQLTNVSRPVVLGLATTFLGAAIGLLGPSLGAWERYGAAQHLSKSDLGSILAFCCSVVATLALGFFAVQGQLDARHLVREIRNRPPNAISPPVGTTVPGAATGSVRRKRPRPTAGRKDSQ